MGDGGGEGGTVRPAEGRRGLSEEGGGRGLEGRGERDGEGVEGRELRLRVGGREGLRDGEGRHRRVVGGVGVEGGGGLKGAGVQGGGVGVGGDGGVRGRRGGGEGWGWG